VLKETDMKTKKRPQYIEKLIERANDDLRKRKVKDTDHYPYADPLFSYWINFLSENNMYQGWNIHVDKDITLDDGTVHTVRALAGPYDKRDEETKANCYVQIW
jgi:hypothetical protein